MGGSRGSSPVFDALNRPLRCLADQQFGVFKGSSQCGEGGSIADIAQNNGGIAQQSATLGAHDCGAAKSLAELLVGETQQLHGVERLQVVAMRETGPTGVAV